MPLMVPALGPWAPAMVTGTGVCVNILNYTHRYKFAKVLTLSRASASALSLSWCASNYTTQTQQAILHVNKNVRNRKLLFDVRVGVEGGQWV